MNLESLSKKFLITSFFVFLFCMGIFLILAPEKKLSAAEYRALAQQPELSLENLVDGSYAKDFEGYFTDQFPGRNLWLKTYMDLQRLTGKTFLNRYYVSEKGWIIPEPRYSYSKESVVRAATELNRLAKDATNSGTEVFYVAAPHRINIIEPDWPEYIKKGIQTDKKAYFMSSLARDYITVLDLEKVFKKEYTQDRLQQMYFKTDHHWNAEGAFKGYKALEAFLSVNSKHFTPATTNYRTINYDSKLLGSYNRQIHYLVNLATDKVSQILPEDNSFESFKVIVNGKESSFKEVYGREINRKDKLVYAEVFTGDLKEIRVANAEVEAGRMLIVKDSFANPIIFHLAQHYKETVVFDIRHHADSLEDFLQKEKRFDTILFLYNDTNLDGELYEFKEAPSK